MAYEMHKLPETEDDVNSFRYLNTVGNEHRLRIGWLWPSMYQSRDYEFCLRNDSLPYENDIEEQKQIVDL